MKGINSCNKDYAVTEVVGGVILILIAVIAFAAIYMVLFPPSPDIDSSIEIRGYVTRDGSIVLEHIGGDSITGYRIDVDYLNGSSVCSNVYSDDVWDIGNFRYPLDGTGVQLLDESDIVNVVVYLLDEKGGGEIIFSWESSGLGSSLPIPPEEDPMLFSSLRNNTKDEDLICHNYTITPLIDPVTYIYNWKLNGDPICELLYPFDTNTTGGSQVKDYSGNGNNGTIFGPTWSSGKLGGGYIFDGNDDYIQLPYCFDDTYIDEITVEGWVKTASNSGVISSYGRDDFWELLVNDGAVRWFTHSFDGTSDTIGTQSIADSNWHYIAASYDSLTGVSKIYVDGVLDKIENSHSIGFELGSGVTTSGYMGTTDSGELPGSWELLTYDDFENGFGNYTDGGRDCRLYTGSTHAHQGDNAADIQDNSGDISSFYHTNSIDVNSPGYTSIKIDFWFKAVEFEYNEDFWVKYYDGNNWITVADYDYYWDFSNDIFYHEIIWINETDYNFPSNMKIKFQCSASSNEDDIYIDEVYVYAQTSTTPISDYNGLIDEFKIYNRVLSDKQIYQNFISTYYEEINKNVIVSDETILGGIWNCTITPNDEFQDDISYESNTIQIMGYSGGAP